MDLKKNGFIQIVIILIVVIVVGFLYFLNKDNSSENIKFDSVDYQSIEQEEESSGLYSGYSNQSSAQNNQSPAPVVSVEFSTPSLNVNTIYVPNDVLVKVSPNLSSYGYPIEAELYSGMSGTGQGIGALVATNNSPQISGNDAIFSFPFEECSMLTNSGPYNNKFNTIVYFANNQSVWGSSVVIDCQEVSPSPWSSVSFFDATISHDSDWGVTPWYYGSSSQQAQGNQELVGYKFTLSSGNQIWIGGPQNTCVSGEFGVFQGGVSTLACVDGFRAEVFPSSPGSVIPASAKNAFSDFVLNNI